MTKTSELMPGGLHIYKQSMMCMTMQQAGMRCRTAISVGLMTSWPSSCRPDTVALLVLGMFAGLPSGLTTCNSHSAANRHLELLKAPAIVLRRLQASRSSYKFLPEVCLCRLKLAKTPAAASNAMYSITHAQICQASGALKRATPRAGQVYGQSYTGFVAHFH